MKWKDEIYTQLEPNIKKYATRFANKTNTPNIMFTELYSEGASISEIWEYLDGLLYHHEIEDILFDACLIQ